MAFAEVNDLGVVLVEVCFPCGDLGLKLRPASTLKQLADVYTNQNGQRASDPSFPTEFDEGKVAQAKIEEGEVLAYSPSSNVLCSTAYGFQLYQEYAALTEAEYVELTGKPTVDLKLTAISLPFKAPGQNSNLYAMDLAGFPLEQQLSVRKVKIFYNTEAAHEEMYLTPSVQVHQEQGMHVFKHVVKLHMDKRPAIAKPLFTRPNNLGQHIQLHEQKSEVLKAQLHAEARAAADSEDEHEPGSGEDEEADEVQQVRRKPLGVGGGSLAGSTLVPKKKARAQDASSRKRPAPELCDDDQSSKKSKGTKKEETTAMRLEALDETMRKVALKHLESGGASFKCLEQLEPLVFLQGEVDKKTLKNTVTNAAGLVSFWAPDPGAFPCSRGATKIFFSRSNAHQCSFKEAVCKITARPFLRFAFKTVCDHTQSFWSACFVSCNAFHDQHSIADMYDDQNSVDFTDRWL